MSYPRDLAALAALLDPQPAPPAETLVGHFGGLRRLLTAPARELRAAGVSAPATARVFAARRLAESLLRERRARVLLSPQLVARVVPHLAWHPVEEVWVVPVDVGLRPLGRALVARGGAASCAVTAKEVLGVALRSRAHGLFLLHNHPSGDPTPSPPDIAFTGRLMEAAKLLPLRIEDHLVLGGGRFASVITRRRGVLRLPGTGRQRWKRSGTVTRFSVPWNCGT